MNLIKQSWQDFKSESDIWFFYAFLLTFPFSIRKVIAFYPIQGKFNEYGGIYLYLSDIFLILALLSWIIILCNKYSILSMFNLWIKSCPQFTPTPKSLQLHPKIAKFLVWGFTPRHFLAYLGLILVLWSFLSIGWSESKSLSLFRSLKLLEFYILAIFVAYRIVPSQAKCSTWNIVRDRRGTIGKFSLSKGRCPKDRGIFTESQATISQNLTSTKIPPTPFYKGGEIGTILKDILKLIIFVGVVNSILAIWQFVVQHSVGLIFLKESLISPDIPGVAKIVIFGHKLIRAYGFFPHPNILGGFLLFSILLTIYYRRMFHVEHPMGQAWNIVRDRRGTIDRAGVEQFKNSPFEKGRSAVAERDFYKATKIPPTPFYKGGALWLWLFVIIQLLALILTFSKSAIIGLALAATYIYVSRRETFKFAKILLATFFLLFAIISFFPNLSLIQNQSLEERQMLVDVSRQPETKMFHVEHFWSGGTFINFLIGTGNGQSVWSIRNLNLQDWQYQPVHNVFVLIWSELGIVGLILFVWMLWKMFHPELIVPRLPREPELFHVEQFSGHRGGTFQGILLGFIFIALFDHYLWDIQQGQILLWLVIGLIYGLSLTDNNRSDTISL